MPPSYWVEALSTTSSLLSILPTKTLEFSTLHLALLGQPPAYEHLRVFSCKCYPNLSATASHKLAPRSTLCVFLSYSAHHKGYRCLDLSSHRVIISRHVIFDETAFPLAERDDPSSPMSFEFLDATDVVLVPIRPLHKSLPAGIRFDAPPACPEMTGPSGAFATPPPLLRLERWTPWCPGLVPGACALRSTCARREPRYPLPRHAQPRRLPRHA